MASICKISRPIAISCLLGLVVVLFASPAQAGYSWRSQRQAAPAPPPPTPTPTPTLAPNTTTTTTTVAPVNPPAPVISCGCQAAVLGSDQGQNAFCLGPPNANSCNQAVCTTTFSLPLFTAVLSLTNYSCGSPVDPLTCSPNIKACSFSLEVAPFGVQNIPGTCQRNPADGTCGCSLLAKNDIILGLATQNNPVFMSPCKQRAVILG